MAQSAFIRQEVRPFTDKQIELVKNFAAQAVIAIENARLLNELRQRTDSHRRLTRRWSSRRPRPRSPGHQQLPRRSEPVFATMLEKAVRICDAKFGNIYRWDGDALHLVATQNTPPAYAEHRRRSPFRPKPEMPELGRHGSDQEVIHVDDLLRTNDTSNVIR